MPKLQLGLRRREGGPVALHSPRPPELLVLDEPETSLHPRVLAPLARQIIAAATRSQVIVVSHAAALVDEIVRARDAVRIELVKENGETMASRRSILDKPSWKWTSYSGYSPLHAFGFE